jgi:hypothetical protein
MRVMKEPERRENYVLNARNKTKEVWQITHQ